MAIENVKIAVIQVVSSSCQIGQEKAQSEVI